MLTYYITSTNRLNSQWYKAVKKGTIYFKAVQVKQ